jgi:hypothetical protein
MESMKNHSSELELLRNELVPEYGSALNFILEYHKNINTWISINKFYAEYPVLISDKKWQKLKERFITEIPGKRDEYYTLTFPGIMLSRNFVSYEKQLNIYLKYLTIKFYEDPDRSMIKSEVLRKDLLWNSEQIFRLGEMIVSGGLCNDKFRHEGRTNWSAGLPGDFFIYVYLDDFLPVIHKTALNLFHKAKKPVGDDKK